MRAELNTPDPFGQPPPHDVASEKAALGDVLFAAERGEDFAALLEQLTPALFYDERHRQVFKAIITATKSGTTPTTAAVVSRLMAAGKIDDCGGVAYVAGLPNGVATFLFDEHVQQLRAASRRRELLDAAHRVARLAIDITIDPEVLAADLAQFIPRIAEGLTKSPEWFRFLSPAEIRAYVPPAGACLVGDNLIVRGNVTVLGGLAGIGKSRANTSLAVAGATEMPWFGLPVHRKFKTAILQNENGLPRLRDEFSAIDSALEEYIRVTSPPAFGLRFSDPRFRASLSRWLAEFQPDLLCLDPWNSIAGDDRAVDYLEAFDLIREVLPTGDAPAVFIVCHVRKPRSGERMSGRSLLAELAGSYALGSVPRSVLVMEPATSDVTDDRVVLTCCKNNDGAMPPRSAWHRRNGGFEPCRDFDFEAFDNPAPPEKRKVIELSDLAALFQNGERHIARSRAASELMETGIGKTAAYDALNLKGRFGEHLSEADGLLSFKP